MTNDNEIDVLYVGFVLGHGGDAVQMIDLAGEMSRRGLRVRILVPEIPTTLVAEERARSQGLDIVRTASVRADPNHSRQNVVHLIRTLRDNPARLYHFHTGDVCLPRLAIIAIGLLEMRPTVVTTHSPYATMRHGEARARHWARAVRVEMDRVVCPSDHSRKLQMSYGVPPDKVTTIRNSVDVDAFAGGSPESAYRTLGLDRDRRLLVFTSRLDHQKRPEDAISVFARIAGEFPDVELVMAGCGQAEETLKANVRREGLESRVHFPGFQSNVADWLAAAAVWIFPTESENFSLALLEALAAGCPIVSTACQGNDEILEDGVNALTTAVGDVDSMVTAVRRLLTDPALAQNLRVGARRSVEQYSISHMVDRYAACYNECLGVLSPRRD